MQIGIIGLGRMGANMARRLKDVGGHEVVGWARSPETRAAAAEKGIRVADTIDALIESFPEGERRVVWVMVPAGKPTRDTVRALCGLLNEGDVIVDGGNSNFQGHAGAREPRSLATRGLHFVDSGHHRRHLGPTTNRLLPDGRRPTAAPSSSSSPILPRSRRRTAALHLRPSGAGHYAKMVHNGIEYGLMQAYAEGFEMLNGVRVRLDLARGRQGLAARLGRALLAAGPARRAYDQPDPDLERIKGWVADSGEGRWTVT